MPRILTFFFILSIALSRLNFSSANVQTSNIPLPDGLFGSNDFAFEGAINDGSASIPPVIERTFTTTLSPQIQTCVDNCLASVRDKTTITDNRPVCGSDSVTYNNHQHFDCTVSCGKNGIQKVYSDKCGP